MLEPSLLLLKTFEKKGMVDNHMADGLGDVYGIWPFTAPALQAASAVFGE